MSVEDIMPTFKAEMLRRQSRDEERVYLVRCYGVPNLTESSMCFTDYQPIPNKPAWCKKHLEMYLAQIRSGERTGI